MNFGTKTGGRSLLQPSALLQYCGYGVWNVHRKNGQKRPLSEWIIVENAHEPIITEDEAMSILAARKRRTVAKRFDRGYGRSRNSSYLLSGGLFVCGSQPYRKGLGCGPGIYVPQEQLERDVLQGLRGLLSVCTDPKGFTQQVNRELRRIWEERSGTDPQASRKIRAIDKKVANIRRAIEDGLNDAGWANARLRELLAEREALEGKSVGSGKPPQMDEKTVLNYRRHADKVLGKGKVTDRKKLLRLWVQGIKLIPEKHQVNITYNLPEHFMNGVVAGACYVAIHKLLGAWLSRKWTLPKKGRRSYLR